MAKADNMLAILWLLRAQRRMTAARMAESLEISERTVYRYIDSLCASGVPIIADLGPDGGYRLAENFQGAPLFFDPLELTALFHAAQFAQEAGYPHSDALEGALTKVRHNLTPEQVETIERHTAAFRAIKAPRGGSVQPWLARLEQAVADDETLLIAYQKPEQLEATERLVDPYGIAHNAGLWYMVGFCHQRQALRQFRVDRIRTLVATGQHFARPGDFRLEQYFSDEWILELQRTGPLTEVQLEGEPVSIAQVADHWYLRYCIVTQSPRRIHLAVATYGLSHLPGVLLPHGTNLRIISPHSLREQVTALATEWLSHHQKESAKD